MVTVAMRVYHRQRAGRPLRIIWTLEEVGEPYEVSVLDNEECKSEAHLARHPLGRVPVLQDDDGYIFESAAMCMQVGDLHPDAGLMPPLGSHQRGLVYQWAVYAPAELEPPLFEAWRQAEQDPDRAAAARAKFDLAAEVILGALEGGEYLLGDQFTVADVMIGTSLLFTTRAGFADELPGPLKAYMARLSERPAFTRAVTRTFG
jgi:glutathione S-transferase